MIVTYRIETRNLYLRYALDTFSLPQSNQPDTCIIDLSSFTTLRAILQCIIKHRDTQRFLFIGNSGMYSRTLRPLISLDSQLPLQKFYEKLWHCPGVSYDMAINLLLTHCNIDNYSHQEKTTVYSLLMRDTMRQAARYIGISDKQFYKRIDQLTKKFNQRGGLQTHFLLRREFHPEYVRARISVQLRISLRQNFNSRF
ncbi:hypothetical protein MXL54_12005 [Enterobacteriaceae bacterium G50]|nr:hypothetical protein [Enterobacteriaceae bacterium G50]